MSDVITTNVPQTESRRAFFLVTLFVLTIATTITYPLFGEYMSVSASYSNVIFLILGWFSTAHVATTAFFYADRDFLPHALSRPFRYIYAPLLVIGICIVVWGLTYKSASFWYPWQVYHSWLLWHYMRQNIGVSALAAQASLESRITDLERRAITASSIGAIFGAAHFGPAGPLSDQQEQIITMIGAIIYAASLLTMAYAIWKRVLSTPGQYITPVFLIAVMAFFAPTFFSNNYIAAVMGYAVAHALQYWFLISLVAAGTGRKSSYLKSLGSLIALTVAIWAIIYASRQPELWNNLAGWIAGTGFGITIAHFVIDADAWRLREKFQRNYVMSRLAPFMGMQTKGG